MTFFEGWVNLFKYRSVNRDLQNWAKIEYKHDAEYAYNHMVTHGVAPKLGDKR